MRDNDWERTRLQQCVREMRLLTRHMDWSQVWFSLGKGSQCYPDECHFGPGWVSFLPVCNEPQWGLTPCSPVPQTVFTNELQNKSLLAHPPSPSPSSFPFQFTPPHTHLSTPLPVTYPVMSPQAHLISPSHILLIVTICLWDSLPFPFLKTLILKSLHVWVWQWLMPKAEIVSVLGELSDVLELFFSFLLLIITSFIMVINTEI